MITGIIAGVILVGAGIPAIVNGKWGVFAVAAVAAAFLLLMGAVSRRDARAYNNMMHFWDTGELPQKRREPHRERVKPWWQVRYELWRAKRRRRKFVREGQERLRTEGKQEVVFCPTCGKRPKTTVRLATVNGEDVWQCQCPACGAVLTRRY